MRLVEAIASITKSCQQVAQGDFETRLIGFSEDPDVRDLTDAINDLIDLADAYVRESSATLEFCAQGKFYRPFLDRGMLGSFKIGAEIINDAREAMQWLEIGAAEQRSRLAQQFRDSVAGLVEQLSRAANDMQETANKLSHGASDTTKRSQTVAAASEEASANTQTVAAAAEELSASISEISRQVAEASKVAGNAAQTAANANVIIESLAKAAEEIGAIVSLIKDVAGQTNLLALNATIEAARAGDAGKGFSVVASEVKNLANQTAKATEEISGRIGQIQSKTKESVSAIQSINEIIERITNVSASIAAAVEEQSASTAEISRNVQEAAAGTRDVSENIGQVSAAADETGSAANTVAISSKQMSSQTETLKEEIESFLAQITNRRRQERYAVNASGELDIRGNRVPVTVVDLSDGGAGIKSSASIAAGERAKLDIRDIAASVTVEIIGMANGSGHLAFRPANRAERQCVSERIKPFAKRGALMDR